MNSRKLINKKAEVSTTIMDNAIKLVIVVVFIAFLLFFIFSRQNGADIWSDYYSKELTRIINSADTGDEITLDVQKAVEIAATNGVSSRSEIFEFNNPKNEVCVKLDPSRKSCYHYFNDVDIVDYELNPFGETPILTFKIK